MEKLFDDSRQYTPDDPEIENVLGSKSKQAQMRYYRRGPDFFRLGRKIIYLGSDLNAWAEYNKVKCQPSTD